MDTSKKLTKKQKKALAFRERKGKGKSKDLELDNDVPVEENQDIDEDQGQNSGMGGEVEVQTAPKRRDGEDAQVAGSRQHAKKRKRGHEEAVGDAEKPRSGKKRKGDDEPTPEEAPGEKAHPKAVGRRYILFVGNLKYTTTKEAVQKHFSLCDPPPTVRLMQPKPSAATKPTAKSKGFAFLEFSHRNALQQGLKLHQSELEGRMINVELTAGGGGRSEGRLEKLKQRNRELHEQRRKRLEKQKGTPEKPVGEVKMERPQRYSVTSGVEQASGKKRTWTVGESTDQESPKRKASKKRKQRDLGTGVNAIPVG
ncbi:hypothetical protein SCP_0106730 [Sparassis crispa]|uniref:RRM domain-containing protein n=1 Tax=Sparassis crispa TaxID=139825 RepID=A0A401G6J5_9APHY|nr:hypothetical protein SCP_0106730 [Sparassis crispa]GBE77791.1 hypothetical protein SCP_0106730 [Sparassis crispa]